MINKCPLCGGDCELEVTGKAAVVDYYVSCQNIDCLLSGPTHKQPVDAIKSFNKLAVMPNPGEAVKV